MPPAARHVLLVMAVLAGLYAGAPAARPESDPERREHVATLVRDLEDLAAWCQKGKLFRERDVVYALLLTFDPEHGRARKRLKYRRDKDGAWTRTAYKSPRNLKQPGAGLERRRRAVGNRFADATLAWLESKTEPAHLGLRGRALRQAARVAPHRSDVRTANGEVAESGGGWILEETVSARTRRPDLAGAARKALEAVPEPSVGRPTQEDNATLLPWVAIYDGRSARVLGTSGKDEAREAVRRAEACFALFGEAFDTARPRIPNLTLMLLTSAAERDTLLANHPRSNDEFRAWAKSLSSGWLPKSSIVYGWNMGAEGRLEWCSRQPIGSLLRRQFGVRAKHGWAFEGFGLYLSHLIAGRRQTFFVRRTEYGEEGGRAGDLWDKLRAVGADWRAEARTLLASPRAPDVRLLLGKTVNTMDTEDMLVSYVLAAYCLEGRREQTPALLTAIGSGTRGEDALRRAMGLDAEGLLVRVRRWLAETKPD